VSRYRSLARTVEGVSTFWNARLSTLGAKAVLALYASLAESGPSASTSQNVHRMLHAAFEDARHLGHVVANPCDVPKKAKPTYRRPEVVPLSREQEAALIDAARGDRYEGIVLLGLDSGARQGELFALTWDDVDFDAGGKHGRFPAPSGSKKPRQNAVVTGFPNVPRDRIELSTPEGCGR
jgi:integrase